MIKKLCKFWPLLLTFLCTHISCSNKNAIVIGASSGMGRELAKLLSAEGYTLGLAARRMPLLQSLQKELVGPSYIQQLDVTAPDAQSQLAQLIEKMNGVDLLVISISSYLDNRNSASPKTIDYTADHGWQEKERILDVDCKGFIAMAEVAIDYFKKQNHGHLVGITSTSGLVASSDSPIYSGIKACNSLYMEGVRHALKKENYNVYVTDIIPGFVAVEHSPLGEDPHAYWEITTKEAGEIILHGIQQKKKVVYVPSKVWLLNLLRYLPDCIYERFFNWL